MAYFGRASGDRPEVVSSSLTVPRFIQGNVAQFTAASAGTRLVFAWLAQWESACLTHRKRWFDSIAGYERWCEEAGYFTVNDEARGFESHPACR